MATKDRGLGRGLSALLGDAALQSQAEGSVSLPINQVQPGLNQPRKRFEPEALDELTESIRTHGIIQPLTVRRLSSGYYQIIAGERRWRAARQAGLTQVPALIIEADDRTVMELGLIENLQREDLNPLEEAKGYETLLKEYGMTQEAIAQRMGKSRPAIANALRLLALPDQVLAMLEDGSLSAGHARALLSLPDQALQSALAKRVAAEGLSVRQTEALAKRLAKQPKAKKTPDRGAGDLQLYLADVEKNLSSRFGRKVKVLNGRKKGKIELEYYSVNDLEALLSALEQAPALPKGGPAV